MGPTLSDFSCFRPVRTGLLEVNLSISHCSMLVCNNMERFTQAILSGSLCIFKSPRSWCTSQIALLEIGFDRPIWSKHCETKTRRANGIRYPLKLDFLSSISVYRRPG